jgi:hypothetical protein
MTRELESDVTAIEAAASTAGEASVSIQTQTASQTVMTVEASTETSEPTALVTTAEASTETGEPSVQEIRHVTLLPWI